MSLNLTTPAPTVALPIHLFAVSRALADLRAGRPVILTDHSERENEADLIIAAETLSVPVMAQMIRDGSGIVCLCLPADRADALQLPLMVPHNGSRFGTAFTISIEAAAGVSTGVSAQDRCTTIYAATAADAQASDLVSPGHVFPLRARAGGVLARQGHTEGSVDLARLAGLQPAGVLCELMNGDGSMMRGAALHEYAQAHGLCLLSMDQLIEYRQLMAI